MKFFKENKFLFLFISTPPRIPCGLAAWMKGVFRSFPSGLILPWKVWGFIVVFGVVVPAAAFGQNEGILDASIGTSIDPNASTTREKLERERLEQERLEQEKLERERLESQIKEKNQELEKVNKELSDAQKGLAETTTERVTLQKELGRIERNISQLNLSIKADQINIQKFGLEIQTLNFDIQDIESSIDDKRLAIAKLIRELERNEEPSLLVVFLKHQSLSDSLTAIQNLRDLNNQLAIDIGNLNDLHDTLSSKVDELSGKKTQVEVRKRNAENRKIIVEDQKTDRRTLISETKNKETIYEQQITELRKKQQEVADEIEKIEAELRKGIDPNLLPIARSGLLGLPLYGILRSSLTQDYGATDFAKSRYGYRGKWHNGIDLRASIGTQVLASEDGEVVSVGNNDTYCPRGAYGRYIVINHSNNLTTLYAHLSRQTVKKGDIVKRGDLIGYSGQSGYATGPHLHFTVFAQPTFYMGQSRACGPMPLGGDLNPLGYL